MTTRSGGLLHHYAALNLPYCDHHLGTRSARINDLERGTRHNPDLEHASRAWLHNRNAA